MMKPLFFASILVTLATAPVFAQTEFDNDINTTPNSNTPRPPAVSTGGLNGVLARAERNQDADALLLAYGEAVTDKDLARLAIGQLLANFYTLRNQANTPEQVTEAVAEASLRFQVLQTAQNQILIQQNQQILRQNQQMIALLGRGPTQVQPNR